MAVTVHQATLQDLAALSSLFAQYRAFYGQDDDGETARRFLRSRLVNEDSKLFIARIGESAAGFTQLYPSFTSIGAQEIWILNDLFVGADHRQQGVAQALVQHVLAYSHSTGRKKVVLSTAFDNTQAQQLYAKLGFTRTEFYNYEQLT